MFVSITCETVINCGGQWARQIGAMAGVSVPLQPVKHQYVITEKINGLSADAPTLRDPDRRTYFKEEVGGLVFGGYEPNPVAWTQGDVPGDFEFQLFEDDWDHFEQHMSAALARVLNGSDAEYFAGRYRPNMRASAAMPLPSAEVPVAMAPEEGSARRPEPGDE